MTRPHKTNPEIRSFENRAKQLKTAAAWSDLGVIYAKHGAFAQAKATLKEAIDIEPARYQTWFNLGNTELESGQVDDAIDAYQHALSLQPQASNVWLNLGNALRRASQFDDARLAYEKAIAHDPANLTAEVNLGNLLVSQKQFNSAIKHYRRAIDADARLVSARIGIGNALCELGRHTEAEDHLKRALDIEPKSAEAHCNLATIYLATDRPAEAAQHAEQALAVQQDFGEALSNLALAKKSLGEADQAIELLKKAVALRPNFTAALSNLGILLKSQGKLTEALTAYRQSMLSAPGDPVPAYNTSLALLQLGEFEHGWLLYENRWRAPNFDTDYIKSAKPVWSGAATQENLLVWPEQGIGDEIMFASLLPQVYALAPNTTVVMDKRLVPLFERSMPYLKFVAKETGVPETSFDYHIPLGSLPKLFCKQIQDFARIPANYLQANGELTASIRKHLRIEGKYLCGISWHSANKKLGKGRSMSLPKLLELAGQADTVFVNLQYGDTTDELAALNDLPWPIIDVDDIDKFNDIDGLAALVAACDYVVSIDNSTVHLSGALGIPTTVLLPGDRDWRWTATTNQSLWYESVNYSD